MTISLWTWDSYPDRLFCPSNHVLFTCKNVAPSRLLYVLNTLKILSVFTHPHIVQNLRHRKHPQRHIGFSGQELRGTVKNLSEAAETSSNRLWLRRKDSGWLCTDRHATVSKHSWSQLDYLYSLLSYYSYYNPVYCILREWGIVLDRYCVLR